VTLTILCKLAFDRDRPAPSTTAPSTRSCSSVSMAARRMMKMNVMQVGLHTRLKPGSEARYEEYHRAVWPDVLAAIRDAGITKYVIFRDGLDLFHYVECENYDQAIAELAKDPVNIRWQQEMSPMMAVAHDFSGKSSDRLRLIFDL
jgi:L-rhamnose mutarotase